MPSPEAVSIPFAQQFLKEGWAEPKDTMNGAADLLLTELLRWAEALQPMRQPERAVA